MLTQAFWIRLYDEEIISGRHSIDLARKLLMHQMGMNVDAAHAELRDEQDSEDLVTYDNYSRAKLVLELFQWIIKN